ncbi:MAG: transposase, partial [Planctomycetota bacterium]
LISFADTSAMNGYLKDFRKHIPANEHILMVMDRAGWHRAKTLRIAENLTLLLLPAYSPELNPAELLWWQMRDKYLSNQVFDTADQLDKDVGKAWCAVTCQPETIRSLCLFPWIESAINN